MAAGGDPTDKWAQAGARAPQKGNSSAAGGLDEGFGKGDTRSPEKETAAQKS